MTPREAWHRYLDGRRTEITEETASTYHYRLKLFVEWCEENGIETVSELNGWTLDQYESARSGEGIAATTLHNEMETIEKFVEYLERIEAVDDWLADRVNIPDVPADQKSRETKLETDRALELLRYYRSSERAGSRNHALLEVAWHTGARLGGIRALDLRDFDASEQTLEFVHRPETDTQLKNKHNGERIVGIRDGVAETLRRYIGPTDGTSTTITGDSRCFRRCRVGRRRTRYAPGCTRRHFRAFTGPVLTVTIPTTASSGAIPTRASARRRERPITFGRARLRGIKTGAFRGR
jgi:site-specific recombinase XerD